VKGRGTRTTRPGLGEGKVSRADREQGQGCKQTPPGVAADHTQKCDNNIGADQKPNDNFDASRVNTKRKQSRATIIH
jgi:hypothetical protein